MFKRVRWLYQEIRWVVIGALHVITGKYFLSSKRYGKYALHSSQSGNDMLRERILAGEPFAYCRFSYTEMAVMIHVTTQKFFGIPATNKQKWLGIFCEDGETNFQGACKYDALMRDAFKEADFLGVWKNLHMGDELLNNQQVLDDVCVTEANSVESYFFAKPWSSALEGKRVLVVSPFSNAIRTQYERRELLWDDTSVLPEFNLDTEDAIWYYGGQRDSRFADWFEAYDYLFNKIMEHDFDVVILACGYFGFALATRIKAEGKQAIHMGGATQLLFGIKGKRWDNNPKINRFYNDNWIRPDEQLRPKDDRRLDNGCYW